MLNQFILCLIKFTPTIRYAGKAVRFGELLGIPAYLDVLVCLLSY